MSGYVEARARCTFTVKEGATGHCFLAADLRDDVSVLGDTRSLLIDLKPGTTMDDAQLLAAALNQHVAALVFSSLAHLGDPANVQ
jgi:hypothetical protein